MEEHANEVVVLKVYAALTVSQSCRSRLAPISVVSATLGSDFDLCARSTGVLVPLDGRSCDMLLQHRRRELRNLRCKRFLSSLRSS